MVIGIIILLISILCAGLLIYDDKKGKVIQENYKEAIKKLEDSYQEKMAIQAELEMEDLDRRTVKYSESCRNLIKSERAAAVLQIEQIKKDCEAKVENYEVICSQRIEEAKEKMAAQIEETISQLTEEISLYEERSKAAQEKMEEIERQKLAVIEKFRADEELREQRDFYHITIEDSIKEDIRKLKQLGSTLSRPAALYKFIYEVYYKAKLEELFSRVLGENKANGGIYKITNINNEKCYIGKTTNFLTRWRTHSKRGLKAEEASMNQLYLFMWEEGIENFSFEIVEVCDKDKQTEREKYWTEFYKSNYYGYNMKVG